MPTNYQSYTRSQAFAGRGTILQYSTNPPSVPYVEMSEAKTLTMGGMKYDLADVTNFESGNFREWLPTLADSGDLTIAGNMIPNDTTEQALIGFFNNATLVTYQIVLPPGGNGANAFTNSEGMFQFTAYVQSIDRSVPHDKEATITIKLKITGPISFTEGY
jgi:predicted secreted protein